MDAYTATSLLRYFHYIPNKTLAIVALVVNALFGIILAVITYRAKCKKFLYIISGTAFSLSIGYLFRILCVTGGSSLVKYIVMTFFLLLPPNALALVNYKATGEIVRLSSVEPKHFFLRFKFITRFFVSSDILAFWLQATGGGLQATSDVSKANLGRYITIVGLAVQLFFFACYTLITAHIHRNPSYQYHVDGVTNPKGKLIFCLYLTITMLYIRSIYRFVEYLGGYDGTIASTEWALYVFDTLPIALSFVFYSIFFIGHYLPKRNSFEEKGTSMVPSNTSSLEQLEYGNNDNNKENVRLYQYQKK